MPRTRTTKKLAQRIDLDYFKRPNALRRWRFLLSVAAPVLAILWVASDKVIMQNQPSSWLARIVVGITTLGMFAAAIGIFL